MKKLLFVFFAFSLFACSTSDDSEDTNSDTSGFSTFMVQVVRDGDVDNWYDELELRTSVNGWDLSNSDAVSDGFLTGNELTLTFTLTSRSKLDELTISYLTTPYFDGSNYSDNSIPTNLNITFNIFEDGEFLDQKILTLEGNATNQATQDFEYNYIVD
jgi:hypothetical protein